MRRLFSATALATIVGLLLGLVGVVVYQAWRHI